MLPGSTEPLDRRLVITSIPEVRARRADLLHQQAELNQDIDEGQVLVTITNVFGEIVEELRSPLAGQVVRTVTFPIVSTGEGVIQLGIPS